MSNDKHHHEEEETTEESIPVDKIKEAKKTETDVSPIDQYQEVTFNVFESSNKTVIGLLPEKASSLNVDSGYDSIATNAETETSPSLFVIPTTNKTGNDDKENDDSVIYSDKLIYTSKELLSLGQRKERFLLENIMHRNGVAALVGQPDTGKSQFARQLAIYIASGREEFISFRLQPVHKAAIYVSTEDGKEDTSFLLSKQILGLEAEPPENLRFLFADTLTPDVTLNELHKMLKEAPADIVVIDSFGDLFVGNDSNNNMMMRKAVTNFDHIGKSYGCLVLLIHHINKAGYKQTPHQLHIQGGSGFVQKTRLVMQLSQQDKSEVTEDTSCKRFLTVVKGNYVPKMYKDHAIELNFSEDTILFESTGKKVMIGELRAVSDEDSKEDRYMELKEVAEVIFADEPLTFGKFTERYCIATGKSIATAKRAHKTLRELGIIVPTEDDKYKLIIPPEIINETTPK